MSAKSKNWKEGAGLYSVLENRADVKGDDVWTRAKSGGIYGWSHRGEMSDTKNIGKKEAAIKGTIRGMLDDVDYSNGAYFWQGVDFHKHYDGMHAYESFYLTGFMFSNCSDDIWNLGDHQSGLNSYNYMFQSTRAESKTTFMKYTNEYMQSQNKKKQWP